MSLLISNLTPNKVLLFSDTLTTHQDGTPASFGPKVDVLPHADVALTTLGPSELGRRWAAVVRDGLLWRGADDLAPQCRAILTEIAAEGHRGVDTRAIAFLFGWSDRLGRFVGWSFDSERGFEQRQLPDGLAIYPGYADDAGQRDPSIVGGRPLLDDAYPYRPVLDEAGQQIVTEVYPQELKDFVSIALARQVELEVDFEAGESAVRIGGHLLMANLERSVTTLGRIYVFPHPHGIDQFDLAKAASLEHASSGVWAAEARDATIIEP